MRRKISRNLEITAHFHALTELRRAIYSDPQHKWRVKDMADRLHLSEGYLQAIYRKTFGVSCMEDVIASRIRAAESLLQYTNKTSLQIAEFCGYGNAEHFCRQFKKLVGKTPGNFENGYGKPPLAVNDPTLVLFFHKPSETAMIYPQVSLIYPEKRPAFGNRP